MKLLVLQMKNGLCRSGKDEKGGGAETEPWPRAACPHHLTVKCQRARHSFTHSVSSVHESREACLAFI